MKILLVAATEAEIAPTLAYLQSEWPQMGGDAGHITALITGVGMVSTTYHLTKRLCEHKDTYDLVLQAGIAGSFDRSLPLGSVVLVESETIGDFGAEDHYQFRDVFELGLADKDAEPFTGGKLVNGMQGLAAEIALPRVSGLTVNTVSGSAFTAQARLEKYRCTIESMEGAALHYVCLQEGIPSAQVRAISNYVEARDRDAWDIPAAVKNLNDWLIAFINSHKNW